MSYNQTGGINISTLTDMDLPKKIVKRLTDEKAQSYIEKALKGLTTIKKGQVRLNKLIQLGGRRRRRKRRTLKKHKHRRKNQLGGILPLLPLLAKFAIPIAGTMVAKKIFK